MIHETLIEQLLAKKIKVAIKKDLDSGLSIDFSDGLNSFNLSFELIIKKSLGIFYVIQENISESKNLIMI